MLQHVKERISSEKETLRKQIAFLEELESVIEMVEDLQRKVPDMHGLAKLIDRVDQIGRDVDMMKLRRGELIVTPMPSVSAPPPVSAPSPVSAPPIVRVSGKRGPKSRLDGHARLLLSMLSKAPGVYTVEDITEMLSMGKPATIRVIRRAVELDPDHMKITTGSRRKIFVHYRPEGMANLNENIDRVKLELMEMAAGMR